MTFLALAVALLQLRRTKGNGFFTGWLFGLGWFGAGISWVHVSIADFGGMPLVASVGIMLLLCSYLALYPALAFYLTRKFIALPWWPLGLPAFWLLAEWLRSWMLSGFPWLSLGYSQIDSPLAGFAPLIGETGISALIVLLCAAFTAYPLKRAIITGASLSAVLFIAGGVLSQIQWTKAGHTFDVAMVQGNIKQSVRWVPEQDAPTMEKYRTLTTPLLGADVIIWPEAAVPKLEAIANDYLRMMDTTTAENNSALVTGVVDWNWESDEAWNRMIVLGAKEPGGKGHYQYGHTNRYAKHHLLPIGEFVPFEDLLRPLAPLFDLPMSSFSRGSFQQTNLQANGMALAPALCFEIAFPRQVNANVHEQTDAIITVSNDAWFGHSHGPAQHLEIARMRAAELQRPVLRATNNGITAFIDARGEIGSRLPQFEAGSLRSPITAYHGRTPYNIAGDLPFYLLSLVGLGIAFFMQRRQHSSDHPPA